MKLGTYIALHPWLLRSEEVENGFLRPVCADSATGGQAFPWILSTVIALFFRFLFSTIVCLAVFCPASANSPARYSFYKSQHEIIMIDWSRGAYVKWPRGMSLSAVKQDLRLQEPNFKEWRAGDECDANTPLGLLIAPARNVTTVAKDGRVYAEKSGNIESINQTIVADGRIPGEHINYNYNRNIGIYKISISWAGKNVSPEIYTLRQGRGFLQPCLLLRAAH